jgi:hypothetical protein
MSPDGEWGQPGLAPTFTDAVLPTARDGPDGVLIQI